MSTRKTKKTAKGFDILNGREFDVEVHSLDMQAPVDPSPESAMNVPVDELINMEYPGLLRDRDQSSILIAILKELVRARRG